MVDDVGNLGSVVGEAESVQKSREDFTIADAGEDGSLELKDSVGV